MSVSVGAATWLPGAEIAKAADLVALADAALYLAKAAGKDRAHPPGPAPAAGSAPVAAAQIARAAPADPHTAAIDSR